MPYLGPVYTDLLIHLHWIWVADDTATANNNGGSRSCEKYGWHSGHVRIQLWGVSIYWRVLNIQINMWCSSWGKFFCKFKIQACNSNMHRLQLAFGGGEQWHTVNLETFASRKKSCATISVFCLAMSEFSDSQSNKVLEFSEAIGGENRTSTKRVDCRKHVRYNRLYIY